MTENKKIGTWRTLAQEFKLVIFAFVMIFGVTTVYSVTQIVQLTEVNGMKPLEQLALMLGLGEFQYNSFTFLAYVGLVVTLVAMPIFAVIAARKLNGQRLLHSIRDGLKDLSTGKFWNFALKAYLPYAVITVLFTVIMHFQSEALSKLLISMFSMSVGMLLLVMILLIVIVIIINTIISMLITAFIVYMARDVRIKQAFASINSYSIWKFVLLTGLEMIIVVISGFIIGFSLGSVPAVEIIATVISVLLSLIIVITITKTIFSIISISLCMSIAKNSMNTIEKKDVKKISQNIAIEDKSVFEL